MTMPVALPILHGRFHQPSTYQAPTTQYSLLPFRFIALDNTRYVATNFAGESIILPRNVLHQFARHELTRADSHFDELKSRHFLLDSESSIAVDLLATQYRTKHAYLSQSTSLFIFVVNVALRPHLSNIVRSRRPIGGQNRLRYERRDGESRN